MNLPPLILASRSPRRAALLELLGVEFAVVPGDAPEAEHAHLSPHEVCLLNAWRKAHTVAKEHRDALVLAADTLVFLDREILAKPADLTEAADMLQRLSGRSHQVVTGVCLLHQRTHRQRLFAESTDVTFQRLDAARIGRYLEKVNPLDKAGAYAIQEHGEEIVEAVDGSLTNVVGLPLERVRRELEEWPQPR
jgi:septum formation protein